MKVLPWQVGHHAHMLRMLRANRIPHALLLRGASGVGKRQFATLTAQVLLCEDALGHRPCGQCRGCQLFEAGSHPDLYLLEIPADKQSIGVESVREIIHSLGLTSQYQGYKVVIINPAEAMTGAAANSFLKTLEEPPGDTVFLLVSHQSARLPATIRSRCQTLQFAIPATSVAGPWLAKELDSELANAAEVLRLARGAPLLARDMARENRLTNRARIVKELDALLHSDNDTLQIAARWGALGLNETVYWLLDAVTALLRDKAISAADESGGNRTEERFPPLLTELFDRQLFVLLDILMQARAVLASPVGMNEQLTIEGMAIDIAKCVKPVH